MHDRLHDKLKSSPSEVKTLVKSYILNKYLPLRPPYLPLTVKRMEEDLVHRSFLGAKLNLTILYSLFKNQNTAIITKTRTIMSKKISDRQTNIDKYRVTSHMILQLRCEKYILNGF